MQFTSSFLNICVLQFSCYVKKSSKRFPCVDGACCALLPYPTLVNVNCLSSPALHGMFPLLAVPLCFQQLVWLDLFLNLSFQSEVGGGRGVPGNALGVQHCAAVGGSQCRGTANPALDGL